MSSPTPSELNDPNHNQSNPDDLVQVEVKIYRTECQDREPTSYLVGDRHLKYPKHEDCMVWLPKGLVYNISAPNELGTQTIRIPRWLAAKKGLKYRE